jgi:hypothetical protein
MSLQDEVLKRAVKEFGGKHWKKIGEHPTIGIV